MIYKDLCLNNQYLYGELEHLSYEIAYCTLYCHNTEVLEFQRQKEAIRKLININLDAIESKWKELEKKRFAEKVKKSFTPKQQQIIMNFLYNEDNNSTSIAKKLDIPVTDVNHTLDKYLTYKLTKVA